MSLFLSQPWVKEFFILFSRQLALSLHNLVALLLHLIELFIDKVWIFLVVIQQLQRNHHVLHLFLLPVLVLSFPRHLLVKVTQ